MRPRAGFRPRRPNRTRMRATEYGREGTEPHPPRADATSEAADAYGEGRIREGGEALRRGIKAASAAWAGGPDCVAFALGRRRKAERIAPRGGTSTPAPAEGSFGRSAPPPLPAAGVGPHNAIAAATKGSNAPREEGRLAPTSEACICGVFDCVGVWFLWVLCRFIQKKVQKNANLFAYMKKK